MSFKSSTPQRPVYWDQEGNQLISGRLYYYEQGANPNTPKTVYSDFELTTPLDQPISVGNDGRTEQQVFLGTGAYTVEAHSYDGAVYAKDNEWDEYGLGSSSTPSNSTNIGTIGELKALDDPATVGSVNVIGYYASGDMFARDYYWDATDLNVDNGGTVIKKSGVATGSWLHDPSTVVDSRVFGLFPDGQGQANSILTSINGWMVGNTETTSSISLVSGTYSCVGDYTQSLDVFTNIEDGVYFNNTTAGTTYNLKPMAGYDIKLSNNLESPSSTGSVFLDVSESVVDGTGNARWWGVSSSNTDVENNPLMAKANSGAKKLLVSEAIQLSSFSASIPIETIGNGSIESTGSVSLYSVESVEGGLIGSGFSCFFGDLRLSWFDSLTNAHGACASYGNALIWDNGAISQGAYTQAVSSPNKFEGSYNITATGAVVLYQVECPDFSKFAVSGGSFQFLETTNIKAIAFDSVQEAINTAQNSVCPLHGNGLLFTGYSALSISDNVVIDRLYYTQLTSGFNAVDVSAVSKAIEFNECKLIATSTSAALLVTGDSDVIVTGSTLSGLYAIRNISGRIKSSGNRYTATGFNPVIDSSFNNDTFDGGDLVIERCRFNSCSFDVAKIQIVPNSATTTLENTSIINSVVNCNRDSGVETGYIEFSTSAIGTKVEGVRIQNLSFVGTADATFNVIKQTLNGSGTWSTTSENHWYIVSDNMAESSNMVVPATKVYDKGSKLPSTSTEAVVSYDVTTDSRFLEFSGLSSLWVVLGSFGGTSTMSQRPTTSNYIDNDGLGYGATVTARGTYNASVDGVLCPYSLKLERTQ